MIDEIVNIRSILKKEIQKKYGQEVSYAKDCQILSESILEKTNRQISNSTIKRFFGIIDTPFKPSKYTLDTIAIYLDHQNWDDLIKTLEENKIINVEPDLWKRFDKRIQQVTNESLNSIKAKIGDQFINFPLREFAVNKMENFLKSNKTATAFIAPGGYGKSTIIAQLTEMFFTGENARYPNDIVCLIDGSILVNLVDLNLEILRMKNVINFEPENSFSFYFRENPDQVKGRFILIIESLYEIYYKEEKLVHFIENLMDIISSFKEFSWFKLVITCKPDDWKILTNIIHNNQQLKAQWFDVSFDNNFLNACNIPPLSKDEVKYYLTKKHSSLSFEHLNFHFPEIMEIITNPYFLHLFGMTQNTEEIHSDIELLSRFVFTRVLIEPFLEEKSKIINSFFQLSDYAKNTTSVEKKDFPEFPFFTTACKELISSNVLYEYSVHGEYLSVKTYLKFTNDTLLGFFLANKWMEENSFKLNLIRHIFKFYNANNQLKSTVIKYLIKYAFKENNTEILKDIYTIFNIDDLHSSKEEINQANTEIINVIGIELRKNKKMRDFLIPIYAESELGRFYYFESFFDMDSLVLHSGSNIESYLNKKHTVEAFVYGHFLKFMRFFLNEDKLNCGKEYDLFLGMESVGNINPAYAGYYYGAQIIYQSVYINKPDLGLLNKVYETSEMFLKSGIQTKNSNPVFEHIILYSLNYGDQFFEICTLMEKMLTRFDVVGTSYTWHNQLSKMVYARALLNIGETEHSLILYKQAELKFVPVNYHNYVKIRFNLIKVEFLIYEQNFEEAKLLIDEIKAISKMLRLEFFYNKALILENKIS